MCRINKLTEDLLIPYRKEFPIVDEKVYLNHAGVAPTSRRSCDAVSEWMMSLARYGVDFDGWRALSQDCRKRFAELIGCQAEEVAFVRNTSHGLALVAEGIAWKTGDRIAVTEEEIEYPSNVHPWHFLTDPERRLGVMVDSIPNHDGAVTVEAVEEVLTDRTRMVAVSSAQFGTGAVTDLAGIGQLCRDRCILFCVDGIQTVGALPLDVHEVGIHFLSSDSHKWMLGMMGMGAFYIHRDLIEEVRPVLIGWKSTKNPWAFDPKIKELRADARRYEEGSPSYALIAGFSAALELIHEVGVEAIASRIAKLVRRAVDGLEDIGCRVGPLPRHRRHIISFTHPRRDSCGLVRELDARDIVVTERGGGVRVSPHFYNTDEEIDRLIETVYDLVK